jgi:hypothetical protein
MRFMPGTQQSAGSLCTSLAMGSVIAVSVAFKATTLPRVDLCSFHRLTGLPCAGCGLTRSFCSISHGEFSQAWGYNPFGYLAYAVAIAILLRPLIAWLLPGFDERVRTWKGYGALSACTAVLMLLFGLWRIVRTMTPSV